MKKVLCAALAAALLLAFIPLTGAEDAGLRFDADGRFRILHLTDTQDDAYPARQLTSFLRRSIEQTQPDLIVFTGDIVEDVRYADIASDGQPVLEGVVVKDIKGEIDVEKTVKNIKKAIDVVFGVFESFDVPYVVALGNNDYKCGITAADWLDIFADYPHLIAFDMDEDAGGRLDYRLTVKGNDGTDKLGLWIMDSGRGGLNDDQVEWYEAEAAAVTEANGGEALPSLWFQHIPIAEVGNLFTECSMLDDGARRKDGKWYRLDKEIANGFNITGWAPGGESRVFGAWKSQGDVTGAFFGHIHVDGFTGTWNGVTMGLTYGCEFTKTGPYGCRVIDVEEIDPAAFSTCLYTYSGSAAFGTDRLELQTEEPYEEYSNAFALALSRIRNFFTALVSIIISLFV